MKMTDPNILSITQTLILSNKNKNNKITKKSSSVTFDHRLFCHVVGKPYEAGNPCFYWLPFGKHSEHFTIQCITLNSIEIRLRCCLFVAHTRTSGFLNPLQNANAILLHKIKTHIIS